MGSKQIGFNLNWQQSHQRKDATFFLLIERRLALLCRVDVMTVLGKEWSWGRKGVDLKWESGEVWQERTNDIDRIVSCANNKLIGEGWGWKK